MLSQTGSRCNYAGPRAVLLPRWFQRQSNAAAPDAKKPAKSLDLPAKYGCGDPQRTRSHVASSRDLNAARETSAALARLALLETRSNSEVARKYTIPLPGTVEQATSDLRLGQILDDVGDCPTTAPHAEIGVLAWIVMKRLKDPDPDAQHGFARSPNPTSVQAGPTVVPARSAFCFRSFNTRDRLIRIASRASGSQ